MFFNVFSFFTVRNTGTFTNFQVFFRTNHLISDDPDSSVALSVYSKSIIDLE